MKIRSAMVGLMVLGGCAVDGSPDLSNVQQGVALDDVLARFRMTGAGAAFVGSSGSSPWTIQYIALDRYVTDTVPPAAYVQFGGGQQDPTSLFAGPYGDYYAAGYSDYAYGSLSPGSAQLSSNNARIRAVVPENSDTFYSERCYYDSRIGYRECISLAGRTIDIAWQTTGEMDVADGIQELDFGSVILRIMGRSTFAVAHATGTLVGSPLQNELSSYITADRGAGVWLEVDPK